MWDSLNMGKMTDAIRDQLKVLAGSAIAVARSLKPAAPAARKVAPHLRKPVPVTGMNFSIFMDLLDDTGRLAVENLRDMIGTKGHKLSRQTIQSANRRGALDMFDEEGFQQVFWMSLSDGRTCPDCAELHGAIMSDEEFWARYGTTRCDGNCRCKPRPVGTAEDYDELKSMEHLADWDPDDPLSAWRKDPNLVELKMKGADPVFMNKEVKGKPNKELAKVDKQDGVEVIDREQT